ncbi:MAG: hypothetical protein B6I38_11360 [Anaerolineaceae bacterium 4572_5.1]|nr:MAG: hypothetical protein B6I38_11360 [Anaerolineaceae bacterium 4572_5.1]
MAADDASFVAIDNPDLIEIGQKLWIPAVASGETAEAVSLPAATEAALSSADAGAPGGHIAFSFNSPDRCTYETNIISVSDCLQSSAQCQASRRIYPFNNVSEAALSPDGERLAFRGWGEARSADSPYAGCAPAHPYRNLGNATLDGTNFVSTGSFWEDSHPDWSPDGGRIIFDTKRANDSTARIRAIGVDGNNEENMLIAGEHPSWAMDSYTFVYRGCDLTGNRCGLWKGAAYDPLSWNRGQNMLGPIVEYDKVAHPDWSPTRDEIVYQRLVEDNWDLWAVNADGSNDHSLLSTANPEGLPSWSPDGNWVAYLSHDGQNWTLRIVSRDGSDDRLLYTYDGGLYTVPQPVEPYGQRDWIDEQISWGK